MDGHAIDSRIYGLNFATGAQLTDLRVPLNRSGGNTTYTYNWQRGRLVLRVDRLRQRRPGPTARSIHY